MTRGRRDEKKPKKKRRDKQALSCSGRLACAVLYCGAMHALPEPAGTILDGSRAKQARGQAPSLRPSSFSCWLCRRSGRAREQKTRTALVCGMNSSRGAHCGTHTPSLSSQAAARDSHVEPGPVERRVLHAPGGEPAKRARDTCKSRQVRRAAGVKGAQCTCARSTGPLGVNTGEGKLPCDPPWSPA